MPSLRQFLIDALRTAVAIVFAVIAVLVSLSLIAMFAGL